MPHFHSIEEKNDTTSPDIPPPIPNNKPKNVTATLHYLSPTQVYTPSTPPIQVVTRSTTLRDPRTTVVLSPGPSETIHDVRGREKDFTLEKNGFCFLRKESNVGGFESRERIWREYVEGECRELVMEAMGGKDGGVDEVVGFHEGKRGCNKEWKQASDGQRTNPFAKQVHVDQTERTIHQIVSSQMDIKAAWLLKGRIRQVNIWRPLYNPVYDCSLCVADSSTLIPTDIMECHRIRESDGAFLDTMGTIRYREGRKWYHKSEMEPDECVLFMGYDSDCARGKREGTGFTLHSAFDLPDVPPGLPPRSSIEVRMLVFTWPKEPLYIDPPMGRLTAEAPPRDVDDYASHHTQNAEIEGVEEQVDVGRRGSSFSWYTLPIPDKEGKIFEMDISEYDPAELTLSRSRSRRDSFDYYNALASPSISPPPDHMSSHLLIAYSSNLTEEELLDAVVKRTDEAKRQYANAMRLMEQVKKDGEVRKKVLGMLNERRKEELRRERERMAWRMRRIGVEDL
ncbi:hypothetical protein EJ08DRAFT_697532 [Tothia fuscella]|uniref:Uncharacterized protein n=1 Tax=Tothia fuscella TaxID=1048955 RepID=A0A9P4NQK0_9PEZI|nr:hypothetical protein EJ08DRAFT_697532 [Tothia fuscella]